MGHRWLVRLIHPQPNALSGPGVRLVHRVERSDIAEFVGAARRKKGREVDLAGGGKGGASMAVTLVRRA